MKRIALVLMTLAMVFFVFSMVAMAQDKDASTDAPKAKGSHKFVGSQACKMCHNTEASGKQYDKWMASPHAKAYEILASPKALEVAKSKNIDKPQESKECLGCHVTGYNADADDKLATLKIAEGVGCEACHGAGADYKAMATMKDRAKATEAGLIIPTEQSCVNGCHNPKSPTYKTFVFGDAYKLIAHPTPKKEGAGATKEAPKGTEKK